MSAAIGIAGFIGSAGAQQQQQQPQQQQRQRQPAQAQQKPKPAETKPAETKPADAGEASARVETVVHGAWVVTCREVAGQPRSCAARTQFREPRSGRTLLTWAIGQNAQGAMVQTVTVPSSGLTLENRPLTAVNIEKGVDLKIGAGQVRQVKYVACGGNACEATGPAAESVKEVPKAETASITFYAADGRAISIELKIPGGDKAIASLVR